MKKNIRKLFLLLAVVITALVCFALSASALDATGQCGDNVYWEYNSTTKELVVSGTGAMADYKNTYGSPFYDSNIESIVINDGVTTIGDYAFCDCDSLTEVTIPDSVTTIGDHAFSCCKSFTEVTIPDSVTTIGASAFSSCDSLVDITVDENNQYFSNDEYGVLFNKDKTTLIQYPTGNGRTSYTIPDSVTTIGESAFFCCSNLTEVTIPDSVTTIGDKAFYSCDSLTEVTIGNSVTTIGEYAFYSCDSLTEVTIGDSVTTISYAAFHGCDNLTDVYYSGTKEQWKKISIGWDNIDLTDAKIHYTCYHINKTTHAQQNPTCTAKGYTAGIHCPDCEKWLSGHEVIPATSHPKKESKPQQNPTCTAKGYTAGTYCPDCEKWVEGHSTINAKGHSYTEKIIDSKHLKSKATVASPAIYKYDCANCDSISPDKTFTHGKALNLGTTSSVTATQTTSSLTLTWSKAENATGYRLYYKLPGDISWRNAVTYTTAITYTFNKLPAGQKYTFAVRSAYKKADGTYILGGYKAIETATKAVNPKEITVTQNTSAIRLSWNLCAGATGYKVYQKVDGEWKALKVVASTTYTIQGLKAGTKYTFAVKPYIKTGSGNIWSSYTEFTTATKPATPSTKLTSPSKGKISLTFGAVNGADGYQVYYKTGDGAYKLYKVYTKAGTLNFSNLKSGTKYTFAVRAGIKTSGGNIFGGYTPVTVTVK